MIFRCSNETVFKKEDLFWAYNFCPTPYSWTALLGLILYLVFFAPGKKILVFACKFKMSNSEATCYIFFLSPAIKVRLIFSFLIRRDGSYALDCQF